jgi:mRNA-degrading endonuclease RelE of RelBE toxin-antitoxin system
MRKVFVLPSFERSLKKLSFREKEDLSSGLEEFNVFLETGKASFGFRLKKIGDEKYEFRVNIKLRVILKAEGNNFYLVLVGNHDDVKRYFEELIHCR